MKQAVAEAVRAEKGIPAAPLASSGVDIKQIEDALLKEREERKALKTQLKAEKKQVEVLNERVKQLEAGRLEQKQVEREITNRGKEIELLHNEISELRQEKILSEQLDEEHSAKMKVYTQDLMATSAKYQQDILSLIGKNERLVKEIEVLKAKGAELERLNAHSDQVQDVLNRKVLAKDTEIASLTSQIEKISKEKKSVQDQLVDRSAKGQTEALQSRLRDLESLVASQKTQLNEQESKIKSLMTTAPRQHGDDDVFGILRSAKSLTPARRVSHLTSRRENQSYAPVAASDYSEWLEPLAIAEHVLSGATNSVRSN